MDRHEKRIMKGKSTTTRITFLAALCLRGGLAFAHPHILIDAQMRIVFDAERRALGVAHVWRFDDAFSAFAVQGYDSKGDGRPTRADLAPLAKINMQSLAPYHFFTQGALDGAPLSFAAPRDFWDEFDDETLELHFTLPFSSPLAILGKTLAVNVFDPDYFAAISFVKTAPVTTEGGGDCNIAIQRPQPLDQKAATVLAAIPADQRELPPDLRALTSQLVNRAEVRCR